MSKKSVFLVAALAALGLLSACSESDPLAGPSSSLSPEFEAVALESDRMTEEIVLAELGDMDPNPRTETVAGAAGVVVDERSFSRTRSCPLGGELHVEGRILRTWDPETRTFEAEITGERTRTDCAFAPGELTITVHGGSMWEMFRRRVDGRPDGLQTSHYSGSWVAVSSDGNERSCSFDYTVVRDPETRSRTVEGTMCDHFLRRRMGWDPHMGG